MTTTTISFHVAQSPAAPRAAERFGALAAAGIALLKRLGRPAAPETGGDVSRVREMARSYEACDPRFASELYAAADRHELLKGN